ncbi:MAG: DUF1844 domain-containing protein [Candidatus Krumholzibacteria bacterium]|nr:DUF1844 domain-containing protein [Candidatus Krumholzibacteria bacterium]
MARGVPGEDNSRDGILFQHILLMLQTLALQQMGKLTNPLTGTVERDLHQARITIDMLCMLQRRTAGNLDEKEKRLLDTVVLELQMNYVDESGRSSGGEDAKEKEGDEEPPQDSDRAGESSQ